MQREDDPDKASRPAGASAPSPPLPREGTKLVLGPRSALAWEIPPLEDGADRVGVQPLASEPPGSPQPDLPAQDRPSFVSPTSPGRPGTASAPAPPGPGLAIDGIQRSAIPPAPVPRDLADASATAGQSRTRLDLPRPFQPGREPTLLRLKRSAEATNREVAASLRQLVAIDEGREDPAAAGVRGAAARATIVALRAGGMEIGETGTLQSGDRLEEVPAVARALGAASRPVTLPAGWWQEDQGHLVGFLRHEAGSEAGEPVALVSRRGGYVIIDSESGAARKVSAALAQRIGHAAHAIYPALPEKVSGLAGLARFLWPQIRPEMPLVLLTSAVIGLVGVLTPLAAKVILDNLVPSKEAGLLMQLGAALAAVALISSAFRIVQKLAFERLGGRSATILNAAIWNRLLRLPAGFFKEYTAGDLGSRIAGIEAMRQAVIGTMLSASVTLGFALFSLGLLVSFDARLALTALGLVAFQALVAFGAGLMQISHQRRQAVISGWLSGFVFQVLQGIVKLRVAGAERRAFARWALRFAEERAAIMASRRINDRYANFADAYAVLSLGALYSVFGYFDAGGLSTGAFVAFIAAFGSFQGALLELSTAALRIVSVLPDFERARPIFEAKPEASAKAADPGELSGAVEVSHLTFAYQPGASPVLNDVSLAIKAGEHIAVVGPSGSGKSTLLRLLLGLETPQSGTVLYDGQDLSSLDVAAVRRQVGVVLQTGRLFAGSIADNIRGATNASHAECEAAARAAGFADDLASFPMGLHTPLTEGAQTISGGQRQRLLIARALVASPRLLFMDEATSALDNLTQAIVTESLARLKVTRLVIAHRLSTVRHADRIVVMERGRIVEIGSFDELMAKDGLFAALASRQLT